MTENWKPVSGYEGTYEVSDQGRVRSLDRVVALRGSLTQTERGVRMTDDELLRAYANTGPEEPTPHANPRHLRALRRVVGAYIANQQEEE